MPVTVEIDVAAEGAELDRFLRLTALCGYFPNVMTETGPGGGWPVVRLTFGTRKEASRFLRDRGYDDELETYEVRP